MRKPLPGSSAPRSTVFSINLPIDLPAPTFLESNTEERGNDLTCPEAWDDEINSLWIDYGGEAG
jgi:hypothetical protein